MGVEEEFALLDPDSGAPRACAPAVLARAAGTGPPGEVSFHSELLATMVESTTGVCSTLAQVREQLTEARRTLTRAAAEEGARLHPGTPAGSSPLRPVGDSAHYRRMEALYGHVATDTETCGCHVHIGCLDRDTAVAVVNHLRPWLPTLLALSTAPAPAHSDGTAGYASPRTIALSRWPTVQIPPHFASAAHYDDTVAVLRRGGVLPPGANAYWLARPSQHAPTVEIRVADVAATVDQAVLQAGLSRALVHTALAARSRRHPAPALSDHRAAAALWTAARYGLHGPALHPADGRQLPATALARELFALLRPALHATGDLTETQALLRRTLAVPRAPGRRNGERDGPAGADDEFP